MPVGRRSRARDQAPRDPDDEGCVCLRGQRRAGGVDAQDNCKATTGSGA